MTELDGTPVVNWASIAYDPHKVYITFSGERVNGFAKDQKISLKRGLNGFAEAKIYLQGTSPWIVKLKEALGSESTLGVEYTSEMYSNALAFRADMYVVGYEVTISNEVPTFVFHLKTRE